VSWADNPWFHETRMPEELEYDKPRDPEKYAHIWLGEYSENVRSVGIPQLACRGI
jgi:phage terminase large subunit